MTIYLLGAGVGESTLVGFPDGQWMLVDCCVQDGHPLPLAALRDLGVDHVDLFVLTHPDVDHLAGLPALVQEVSIEEAWRYPSGTGRDVLAHWARKVPGNRKLKVLTDSLAVLDGLERQNRCSDVQVSASATTSARFGECVVRPIAPCPADYAAAKEIVSDLARAATVNRALELDPKVEGYLLGKSRGLDCKGNPLSVGLSVAWGNVRVVLAGDVEAGEGPASGWKGVVEVLGRADRLHELLDVCVVGVAHHGSNSAYSRAVWKKHSHSRKVAAALITPFARSHNSPPHKRLLQTLTRYSDAVALSAAPYGEGWQRVEAAGWRAWGTAVGSGHWIAASIGRGGTVELHRGDGGRTFVAK